MAGRTHRADRRREPDGYPDENDNYREEDNRPDDHPDDQTDDDYDDDYGTDEQTDEQIDGYYDDDPDDTGTQTDDDHDDPEDRTEGRGRPRRRRSGPARSISAQAAAWNGARHIAGLTGKPVTGVTSLDRTEHGWVVGVEVVEDARVPSSADILAVYQTELDAGGELTGYQRTRRYPRGRGDSGNGAR